MSVILWFLAALLCFVAGVRRRELRADLLFIGYILLIARFRELDFHNRFTPGNLGHPVKYLNGTIPLSLRLPLVAFVAAPIATTYILALTRWRRRFFDAWAAGDQWTRSVLGWIALFVVARVADKLSDNSFSDYSWLFRAAQESAELGLPVLTVLLVAPAALAFRRGAPRFDTTPAWPSELSPQ